MLSISAAVAVNAMVALRKESVDRNTGPPLKTSTAQRVALRKESVDRNLGAPECCLHLGVALRKESVDRNTDLVLNA